jgi:signal transduction histidine kinase
MLWRFEPAEPTNLSMAWTRLFLRPRLIAQAGPTESFRIERVISVSRLVLAIIALVAFDIGPDRGAVFTPTARALLVVFIAHSSAALLVLRSQPTSAKAFGLTTHCIDVVAVALTLPVGGPTNQFFGFFLFVLSAAAFRWGFRETVATALAAVLLMVGYLALVAQIPELSLGVVDPLSQVLLRTSYLVIIGLLLGLVTEESRLLRAETGAVVGVLRKIRIDAGVTRALTATAHDIATLFNATHLLIVVEDLHGHRVFRWDSLGGWSVARRTSDDEDGDPRRVYFFGSNDHSAAFSRRWWPWVFGSRYRAVTIDETGRHVAVTPAKVPDAFVAAHPFRRLLSAPVRFGDEWAGRIFIFDPALNVRPLSLVQLLQTLVQQVGPAVFSVYLQQELRARAGAVERARVARELHDGVIQSLIGVEMQLEVLRSQQPVRATPIADEVARLQGMVRNEVLNLRELMQQMRPVEFDPDEVLDYLADMVQRFGRDTGITSHFLTDLKEARPERTTCFEFVRIVQEALVNIRKHSAATNVVVRFGSRDRHWMLEIDDDGRGFPFEGRLTQADLDARRTGPVVIKERVRAIGGQLSISSAPGRGARLEVLVPQEAHG